MSLRLALAICGSSLLIASAACVNKVIVEGGGGSGAAASGTSGLSITGFSQEEEQLIEFVSAPPGSWAPPALPS